MMSFLAVIILVNTTIHVTCQCFKLQIYLQSVLVCSGTENDVTSLKPLPTRKRITQQCAVDVTHMWCCQNDLVY